jgi:benzoylformate decarboxylase
VLGGDMVSVTRPWTKWSLKVQRIEDIPAVARRAIQTALTPPTGPVFIALPVDVQMEIFDDFDLTPAHVPHGRVRPPLEALHRAAEILSHAKNSAILAGSRVTEARAIEDLVVLAERLGAPVFAEGTTSHGRLPMPADHPLYSGILPFWAPDVRELLAEFDAIFVVGMDLLHLYIYREPDCPIPENTRVIHLDTNPREIGKNYPVELGLIGHPGCGMAELDDILSQRLTPQQIHAAQVRRQRYAEQRKSERQSLLAELREQQGQRPITALALMGALAGALPGNAVVVEEAPTTHGNVLERLGVLKDPTGHFAHRGWALGWGLGCALGVKLAWPHRPVVALLGDGSALYGIQGLWSAAHHNIPVTFIICNNAQYKILKMGGSIMSMPHVSAGTCPGTDLVQPEVDFVNLARSFGVEAHRVSELGELSDRIRDSLTGDRPQLFDVPIER